MKKLSFLVLVVVVWSVLIVGNASADCGGLIEGNWNIKKAGDLKGHLHHRLKIVKTGSGTYAVKIKNGDGDVIYKSKNDFSLSCDGAESAKLAGNVKMGNCMHALEVGYPSADAGSSNIYVKITSDHDKGECRGHKDSVHDKDPRKHTSVAYGKRPDK